jgi:hypothetical protein
MANVGSDGAVTPEQLGNWALNQIYFSLTL